MSEDNICLPFPCVENATTPVEHIFKFHGDNESRNAKKYYFTIGIDKFRPSPCTFLDTASTRAGDANRTMLIILFHLLDVMFYAEQPDVIQMVDGGRRVRVFMEYLLHEDTDSVDFTLIDCVGVRFHIHIYDHGISFLDGILKMISTNGGGGGPDIGDDIGDEPATKRRKGGKKRVIHQRKKNSKSLLQEAYKGLVSILGWYDLSGVISDTSSVDHYTSSTTGGERYVPDDDHPFHPDNLFTWDRSLVSNMLHSQTIEHDVFSVPGAVYNINGYMTTPSAILGVTLPRTPMWFHQPDANMILETFQSLYNKDYMDLFFERRALFIKRNDLYDIRQVQERRRKKLLHTLSETPEQVAREIRVFRERSIKYLANSWNPTAFVSDPIKTMARVSGDMGSWTTGPLRIVDPQMSTFGNMMADTMLGFENILRISTTHAILLRLIVNSLDAYRYEFNLHNNILLVGAGATGKSHLLEQLEKFLFLDGTVTKVSHLTDKAMTVDTDANDAILTFHEMPQVLMGTDKNSGDTGSGLIKDLMTSCKVDTYSIHVDDGRRFATKCSSERVSVILMASNEPRDLIPEALATRMQCIQVNTNTRQKFSINDMTSSIDGVRGGDYFQKSANDIDFERRWKITQIMVNMVEKAIYTGSLEDVNICVFDTLQLKMTDYMKNHDELMQKNGNDREIKFMKRFARTLTIIHAVNKFANDPLSPGFDPYGKVRLGSPESFDTLLHIQPYLFCTEEIAMFTLTLNADQLIQVHHFQTMEVVLALVEKTLVKSGHGTYDEQDGYYYTRAMYQDERYIYRKLSAVQNTDMFPTKLSAENIKVAFRELRRRVHDERTIIEFNSNTQTLLVNSSFVKDHFTWDSGTNHFKCNFDLNNIMSEVFYKAYANKHTRPMEKMILGTTYDRELPFLFNTIPKEPNPDTVLTRCIAQSNVIKGVEGVEFTSEFTRKNDTIEFKVDFEDFCFKRYLEKCGYAPTEFDLVDKIYDHHVVITDTVHDYPAFFVKWFNTFTGIDTNR
jgi:hypothetical protein